MQDLRDIPVEDLPELARSVGLKPFGARQIYEWLYQKDVTSIEQMSNLSLDVRKTLSERYKLSDWNPAVAHNSTDGTTKYLFSLSDKRTVETVLIPARRRDHRPRNTVCISTQVGCTMGCTFCHTATMGLVRNLSRGEIVGQVLAVRRLLAEEDRRLNNVVLMGMGEPLHNYDETVAALRLMVDQKGVGLAPRRVTVSTVGLVPAIRKFAKENVPVKLALSLHATTDEVRQTLIPLAKRFTIDEILDACNEFLQAQSGRGHKITFEYLMLKEVNDTPEDAKRLISLASRIPSKVNLIPLNPWPDCPWQRPEDERIDRFADALRDKSVDVYIRHSRGQDILAACGQLATDSQK